MPFSVTLILPPLESWLPAHAGDGRYSQLEWLLSRAVVMPAPPTNLDHLRMRLFGLDDSATAPVAALSHLGCSDQAVNPETYYLRVDPVRLQADMSHVMMVGSGLSDYPSSYRQEVEAVITAVLAEHGMTLSGKGESFWTVELDSPPGVHFASLDDALGADISECLPEGETATPWKQLLTEIQMALHALPENQERRECGASAINSVWFWGGGYPPAPRAPAKPGFDRVVAEDAVSLGLARLHSCQLESLQDWLEKFPGIDRPGADQRILIDWASTDPELRITADRLEAFCGVLLEWLKQAAGKLEVVSPGHHWKLRSRGLRHFWKRRKPLSSLLAREASA